MERRQGHHQTVEEKNKVAQFLLENCSNGKPDHGKFKEAVHLFGICKKTVYNIWKAAKKQLEINQPIMLKSGRLGVPMKKRVFLDEEAMKKIAFKDRTCVRDLALSLGQSKSTVSRWIKDGLIKPHTNAIKPALTEQNKHVRIQFCLSQLWFDSYDNIFKFNSMRNVIHIDEKWFYLTNTTDRFYKLEKEAAPYRSCKSKRFITKVMFLCAVGRPHYDNDGTLLFDGKVGMFPFTQLIPASRNSKNRVKGTLELKNIESITKQIIKDCIINQVIPTLKAKWPMNASKHIFIQQDNARPHINNTDLEFREAASSDGFNMQLICQPPNSPDSNINDVGWFRSLQSLQQKKKAYNVESLVQNVGKSFDELTPISLNKTFLSLQAGYIEILKHKGHNNFALTHMGKDKLIREDNLPDVLTVDEVLVRESIEHLLNEEVQTIPELDSLMSQLGY